MKYRLPYDHAVRRTMSDIVAGVQTSMPQAQALNQFVASYREHAELPKAMPQRATYGDLEGRTWGSLEHSLQASLSAIETLPEEMKQQVSATLGDLAGRLESVDDKLTKAERTGKRDFWVGFGLAVLGIALGAAVGLAPYVWPTP